jgi:hypothetical protein
MFNVVKFVVFAWWLPKHGVCAVDILRRVASSASAHPLLLANFTQSELVLILRITFFRNVFFFIILVKFSSN